MESDQRRKSEQQDTEEDQRAGAHRAGSREVVCVLG
jgi:hypothetical protein